MPEKKISSAGARTHENETRPEEIYDHQRVCIRKLGFEQGLQKLPKFDINNLRVSFHLTSWFPGNVRVKPYSKGGLKKF